MDPKITLEVARSLYAQMCLFHEETEEQHIQSEKASRHTALLVKSIGTLLMIFVIVIGFYITDLSNQFIQIIDSMNKMNEKVVVISEQMSGMSEDIAHMNDSVRHMDDVLSNMKHINRHVKGMEGEMDKITDKIVHIDALGERAMRAVNSMNKKMDLINWSTERMNIRMHQISKPFNEFTKP